MDDHFSFPFRPSHLELMLLLQLKAEGGDIKNYTADGAVLERNMYGGEGTEPWNVVGDIDDRRWEFHDDGAGNNYDKRALYVITKLARMGAKKTVRRAGFGTWEGQTKPKNVKEGNKVIGAMRMLNFLVDPVRESEASGKGYWYMHEYSLPKEYINDYVICRIIRDDSKNCPVNESKATRKDTTKNNPEAPPDEVDANVDHQESSSAATTTTFLKDVENFWSLEDYDLDLSFLGSEEYAKLDSDDW